ncbi:MAG TPA: NADH-quinone oxidoreductase subunit D [Planctomycetota bacterium]|nr:NADH-quinone oxidoreductase subunit D [Planctomycetota bacterium]
MSSDIRDDWFARDPDMLEQEKQPDSVHFGELPPSEQLEEEPARNLKASATPSRGYRQKIEFVTRGQKDLGESMLMNMGPQHPSTHGVLRIELVMSGEVIQDVRCHIGYMHRCAEKESENSTYIQAVPYTDRLDYVAPMTNAYAYSLAVERLMGLSVPAEVEFLRMAINELERIASHLLAIATFGIDLGAFTPFLYAFEARERILKFFELLSGGHLLYNYIWPGGVQRQPPSDFHARMEELLRDVETAMSTEIDPVLTGNRIFVDRTAKIGILTPETALAYAITGPNLRGSGISRDLRRDEPCARYHELDFEVCIGKGEYGPIGSCLDRYLVRVAEIRESIKLVRQCLPRIPEKQFDVHAGLPATWNAPAGECYFRFETARGELGIFLISDGSAKPYRCKYRSPGFHSIQVIPEISRGCYMADMPAIIGSLDFVMCEVDR